MNTNNLDSECYFGRHAFKLGVCTRPNCIVDQNNIVHISARRWFNKTFGNTYHSVTVGLPGDVRLIAPYEYGYDRQYEQTALALLQQHFGDIRDSDVRLFPYLASKGYYPVIHCEDVPRKKDLAA